MNLVIVNLKSAGKQPLSYTHLSHPLVQLAMGLWAFSQVLSQLQHENGIIEFIDMTGHTLHQKVPYLFQNR